MKGAMWYDGCKERLMVRQPARRAEADGGLAVDIRALEPGELRAAVAILARAMADNPLHVRVFGRGPLAERRLSCFLVHVAGHVRSNGELLGAFVDDAPVGVLGMMRPEGCRPPLRVRMRLGGAILAGNPPAVGLRIGRWLSAWARNDPAGPHWHIGPLAVSSAYRGQGVGRRLMVRCCQHMDALGGTAYLETDLAINVEFYQALGFAVTGHARVLGVPNWFMTRRPARALEPPAVPPPPGSSR